MTSWISGHVASRYAKSTEPLAPAATMMTLSPAASTSTTAVPVFSALRTPTSLTPTPATLSVARSSRPSASPPTAPKKVTGAATA
jgi:hypothetical protein